MLLTKNVRLVTGHGEGIASARQVTPAPDVLGTADDLVRSSIAWPTCVVLPSYREGMPRVPLEAAAIGRPLIPTDATGCRQVVDLAHRMRCFLGLDRVERQRTGDPGRGLAKTRFNVHKLVQKCVDLVDAQLRDFLKDQWS